MYGHNVEADKRALIKSADRARSCLHIIAPDRPREAAARAAFRSLSEI